MKQYLLAINESQIQKVAGFFGLMEIDFLEIQGMDVAGKQYQILVTPSSDELVSVPELEEGTECGKQQ